jgi:hypothetical protein
MSVSGFSEVDMSTSKLAQVFTMTHEQIGQMVLDLSSSMSFKEGQNFYQQLVATADLNMLIKASSDLNTIGRKLLEGTTNVLKGHDGGLVFVAVSNFPLDQFIIQYKQDLNVLKAEIIDCEKETKMDYPKPETKEFRTSIFP